jgi:hypothetical protein
MHFAEGASETRFPVRPEERARRRERTRGNRARSQWDRRGCDGETCRVPPVLPQIDFFVLAFCAICRSLG